MTIDDKEWQKLCQLVADEPDPQRLSELVSRLIKALDDRNAATENSVQPPNGDRNPDR